LKFKQNDLRGKKKVLIMRGFFAAAANTATKEVKQ